MVSGSHEGERRVFRPQRMETSEAMMNSFLVEIDNWIRGCHISAPRRLRWMGVARCLTRFRLRPFTHPEAGFGVIVEVNGEVEFHPLTSEAETALIAQLDSLAVIANWRADAAVELDAGRIAGYAETDVEAGGVVTLSDTPPEDAA